MESHSPAETPQNYGWYQVELIFNGSYILHPKGNGLHMVGMVGGVICFFCRWPRDFQYEIRDGKRQCQVGPWKSFVQPQREVKYEYTVDK